MAARFKVTVDQPAWLKMVREKQRPVATAAVAALQEVAENSVEEGRRDIAAAGKFGRNWQRDLKFRMVNPKVNGEPSLQAKAVIFHKAALAIIFETGITIVPKKNLLWIPTKPHMSAPGVEVRRRGLKLTAATVRGTPMLFDARDRDRHRRPLYIGVPSATIGKIWHITEIVKANFAKLGLIFIKFFRDT